MKKILVLLYHGVTNDINPNDNIRNYNLKHINRKSFQSQIEIVSKFCKVISIDELVDYWHEDNQFDKPTALITFDDGFKNNFYQAKPILEKYEVPATFYVSTGNISNQELFWVDKLEIIFNKSKIKELENKSMPYIYELIKFDNRPINFSNRDIKINILDQIKIKLKLLHPKLRNQFINNISAELEVENSFRFEQIHNDYAILNWEELKEMNASSLFTIGGHSRWHNILSKLTGKELEEEIYGSIKDLKINLGSFSGHYAYPEGQNEHFNLETKKVLKKFGVKACPSARQGLLDKSSQNLFNFKRVMIGIDNSSEKILNDFIS